MSDTPDAPVKSLRSTVLIFALLIILAIAVGWSHLPFDKKTIFFWADDPVSSERNDGTVKFSPATDFPEDTFPDEFPRETESLSHANHPATPPLDRDEPRPFRSTSYQGETPFLVEGERNPEPQQHVQTAFSSEVPPTSSLPQKTTPPVTQEYLRYQTILETNFKATESHLEYWGSDGKLVRFTCYVPSPKLNPGAKKHFQAIAATPLDAIEKVARDVHAWQKNER